MRRSHIARRAALAAAFAALASLALAEEREAGLDLVILIDSSLSMEGKIERAREFAAAELVGALLLPGDRLIIESFYGQVDRIFAGRIDSESDKARAARSLREIEARGRYTDLGAALDRARDNLAELGAPERPKYVLVLSDERQEAPPGSPYASADYRLRHQALDYVDRRDLGGFSLLTIGFGLRERVEAEAGRVLSLLSSPPRRAAGEAPPPAQEGPRLPGLESLFRGEGPEAGEGPAEEGPAPGSAEAEPLERSTGGAVPEAGPSAGVRGQDATGAGLEGAAPARGSVPPYLALLGGLVLAGFLIVALLLKSRRTSLKDGDEA